MNLIRNWTQRHQPHVKLNGTQKLIKTDKEKQQIIISTPVSRKETL